MDQYVGKLLDDRYEILDAIGVGGMAMVYKAYCHRLHRFVALKILRKELASDAEFRRRFHDEAQAVAMLSHPNIVSVYDVSRDQQLEYIVMELIDGITLKQYMKKKGGKLGWRESLHYMTQIMRALSHAHSRGIIHRDIKPQNIMVLRDGSVRVADFGIARVMSAAQKTLTQEALGSVHYISPEQARGSHLDERADIYSAGVVLYEMLTGRLPFEGDSPVSVAIQHISSIPLAPRELNSDIPEPLEAITLKAMSSSVERRYKNAEEMIADLEEFRKNPSVDFGYEHYGHLQSDEPTQVLETSSLTGALPKRKQSARAPAPAQESFDFEDYDDYQTGGVSRRSSPAERRSAQAAQKKSSLVPILAVVCVFLLGVGIFLWLFFFSDLFKGNEVRKVPDLRGRTIAEVMQDTSITDQFTLKDEGTKPSDQPEGQIIEQSPAQNEDVKYAEGEKSEIAVYTSGGKAEIIMIDVTKTKTYIEALEQIKALGLKVAEPEYLASDEVVKDYVIATYPTAGTPMAKGDTVRITVSKGAEVGKVTVPQLVNAYTGDKAKKLLEEEYQLKCNISGEIFSNDVAAGLVAHQSIPFGTEVDAGSSITLQISKGPEKPVDKNRSITVTLPTDRESVSLQVLVDDKEQYSQTVGTAGGTILVPVTGSGSKSIKIIIDGEVSETYDFDFDR